MLYTCISFILCIETLITFASESVKSCLHVPELFEVIPSTETLHLDENGQIMDKK